MTPEREKYLASISGKERTIRSAIRMVEYRLKEAKEWWTRHANSKPKKIGGYKRVVKREKLTLMACKRELARLKEGTDNVVVPYEVMRFGFEANVPRVSYDCECFEPIDRKYKFCPYCGRKLLWERVK